MINSRTFPLCLWRNFSTLQKHHSLKQYQSSILLLKARNELTWEYQNQARAYKNISHERTDDSVLTKMWHLTLTLGFLSCFINWSAIWKDFFSSDNENEKRVEEP